MRILVVEDEVSLREGLHDLLTADGHDVVAVGDGAAAVERGLADHWELVVLDLMLPRLPGVEVCRRLRAARPGMPILMLTARGSEDDKVRGLGEGADDYVTKPFSIGELLARVRAALRRASPLEEEVPAVVRTPDFSIDLAAGRVTCGEETVHLTPLEWRLVEALVRRPGRLVTQRQLLQIVWGPGYGDESNYLRVHMTHVRRKLEPDPTRPRYFHTEAGLGYRYEPPRDTA